MSTAQRLQWLIQEVHQGRNCFVAFSYNPETQREKIKFMMEDATCSKGVYRPCLAGALMSAQWAIFSSISTDKGHKSSGGQTVVQFWLKQASSATVSPEPGAPDCKIVETMHGSNTGDPSSARVDGEALMGIGPFSDSTGLSTTFQQDGSSGFAQEAADALMETTAVLGTPDFCHGVDPAIEVPPLSISQVSSETIEKSDWRYATHAGLQMVISNLNAFLGAIDQLSESSPNNGTELQYARLQCLAVLDIANNRLEELCNTRLSNSSQEAAVEMERGQIDAERLMARSDEMKDLLLDIAGGDGKSSESPKGSTSGAAGSSGSRTPVADTSAVQRLMAPKAGKPHCNKKPPKRSGAPGLRRNDEGKHVRR